ncbi:hypothetical protein F5Y18DRAFT_390298 [Xylariaceae sp. FL1019]|nr:hypothetical protein F5Y18DRAFT_390298 [Xylariaceae sp. FL1019]
MLSIGVQCVRELRLNNSNNVRKAFTQPVDQELVQRAVWVLYCQEITHSVIRGIPPVCVSL